jgi:hypothetical protein
MLRFAILNGLRPSIANAVIAKAPKTIAELLEAARIAELTTPDINLPVMEQLSALKTEMQRIGKQLDKHTTSFIASERQSPARDKRVTFSQSSSAGAANATYSPTAPRRSFDRRQQKQQQQHWRPQPPPQQQRNSFFNRNQQQNGSNANQGRCNRCGYSHVGFRCPAEGKTCLACGRLNHFRSQCRSSARDSRQQQQ